MPAITRIGQIGPHCSADATHPTSISLNRAPTSRSSSSSVAGRRRRAPSSHAAASRCASLEQLAIADEIDQPEGRHAGLARAEEIARAAQQQIALGDLEAVGRLGHRLQPLARFVGQRRLIQQAAVTTGGGRGRRARAAGAAATARSARRARRSSRWRSARRRRPRRPSSTTSIVQLAGRERLHHAVLRVGLQPAVQQADAVLRKDFLREMVGHLASPP